MFSAIASGAESERSFKERSRVRTKTRNSLIDYKGNKQSFIVFYSVHIDWAYKALNGRRSTSPDICVVNSLFGDRVKDLFRREGLVDFDDEYTDATEDMCNVLIDYPSLKDELDSLLEIGND